MISTLQRDINGNSELLKFSTRAQARVERQLGVSIQAVLRGLGDTYGIDAVAEILAASWSEGRGCQVDRVYDVIDAIGQESAGKLVAELVSAAFPQPQQGGEASAPEKK